MLIIINVVIIEMITKHLITFNLVFSTKVVIIIVYNTFFVYVINVINKQMYKHITIKFLSMIIWELSTYCKDIIVL